MAHETVSETNSTVGVANRLQELLLHSEQSEPEYGSCDNQAAKRWPGSGNTPR